MAKLKTISTGQVEAKSISSKLTEKQLKLLAPAMPTGKTSELLQNVKKHKWEEHEGINEKALFDNIYSNIATVVYKELGPRALKLFSTYKPIAEAATLTLVKEVADGTFKGVNAAGATEFTIQAINMEAFDLTATDRIWTPSAGANHAYPRGSGYFTPTEDKEALVIFGYATTMNPRIIERIDEDLQDAEGERLTTTFFTANKGDVLIKKPNGGPRWVRNNQGYDCDITVNQSADTDFAPTGIRIASADTISTISP